MFSTFERTVAFRYLRARKEGFISVIAGFSLLGIALGVATLIVVMAVMNGFRQELLGRILGINGHMSVYEYADALRDFDKLAEDIRTIPGIKAVTPLIDGQVMVVNKGFASGAMVKGMRYDDVLKKQIIANNIKTGELAALQEPNAVILGSRLAEHMGVGVGDNITLVSPQGTATVVGMIPRLKNYTVAATFEVGMYEYDSSTVIMPLDAAQLFFKYPGDTVASLEIMVNDPDSTPIIRQAIVEKTGGKKMITDWKQANASFFNALKVERNVMFLILTLIILVAAFNIISSLIMLVNDKRRNIAILRTMGATRGMTMRIFFLCGASIGITGAVLGVILGVSFAANIQTIQHWVESITGNPVFDPVVYFLSALPADINIGEVASVFGMALGLSFLATIYPSWKAAQHNPAEALRYE